jgi:hypothetical protein
MKRIFFIALLTVFAISACQKDQLSAVDSSSFASTNKTETLILSFKDKLANNLKDGTIYTTDSAVWYVEALMNYTYGNTTSPCSNPIVDTTETIVNATGENGFTLAQLADVYEVIEAGVINNKPGNSNVFAIDLYSYPAGNLTVFASRAIYAPPVFKSVMDTAGYWFWGCDEGMCGADSGLYVGTDASDILDGLLNTISYDGYWTSLETFYVTPNDYQDTLFPFNEPFLYPTRLFSNGAGFPSGRFYCISPELMAYYNSNKGIRYIIKDLCPLGKQFCLADIEAYYMSGLAQHTGDFTYGILGKK